MNLYRYPLEVRTYAANVIWNGGSVGSSTLNALSKFVNSLKLSPLWTKLDEIYPLCGRGIASACVKLKFVAAPFMTNNLFADEDFEEWGPNSGLTATARANTWAQTFPPHPCATPISGTSNNNPPPTQPCRARPWA
jgi:hypothetical protein